MERERKVRILVADDHGLFRDALTIALNAQPDMTVVAEAANNEETLQQALKSEPNLILLDITMPDGSGIAIIPELREHCPDSRILVVTMHHDPSFVRTALAMGAHGYFRKSSTAEALFQAIREVCRGEQYIDESLRQHMSEIGEAAPLPIAKLSLRELQVLVGLIQGHRYQVIADKMKISVRTVETYRSRLTAKLGITNRADLMRFAIDSGILKLSTSPSSALPDKGEDS